MKEAGLPARVNPIPTAQFPTPAKRPLNSRLDCGSLERDFGIARPDWRAGLRDVLRELGA
jgi:dTDP-4-dehydrorhamnose reductase